MKTITIEDLKELGRLLKDTKCRPLTKQEIENFGVIPEGATFYKGGKSYWLAVRNLDKRKVLSRAGSDSEKGLYWALEEGNDRS